MPRGSDRAAARPFLFLLLRCAAPSEASSKFTRDRRSRAKEFSTLQLHRWNTLSSTRRERRALAIVLSSSDKPSHLPHCQHEEPLCRILFASVRRQVFGDLLWHSQFHSNQFAHAALFHCHSVKNIGFGNGAFVVSDDNELALLYEAVQDADKAVDVAFIHRCIHFIENAERARSHHVDGE